MGLALVTRNSTEGEEEKTEDTALRFLMKQGQSGESRVTREYSEGDTARLDENQERKGVAEPNRREEVEADKSKRMIKCHFGLASQESLLSRKVQIMENY